MSHPSLPKPDLADRAAGCIVGAFVGDALGLGPHWYYDLDELRSDFGPWIDGYTDPKPDARYHAGMKAGELSQTRHPHAPAPPLGRRAALTTKRTSPAASTKIFCPG